MDDRNDNLILLPVLPLRGLVVFPKALIHFDVGRKKSISAINAAMKNDQLIFLVTQKDAAENDPDITKCYTTGVVAKIVQVIKQPDNSTRVVIEGKFRAGIVTPVFDKNCLMAEVVTLVFESVCHLWEKCRRMLQIGVHNHHIIGGGMLKSCVHSRLFTEIP